MVLGGGRYTVRGLLGEGAQGKTFEAHDAATGRAVAIKRYDVRGARTWKEVELAEREARVLATLDHPLVPRYLEHFEEDGALYLVMEKVEGETLEASILRNGALPESEVRRFLACADRAFSYLHGRAAAVIHRDVKPRNVIRRADGSYVFVDFGAVSELFLRRTGSTVAGTLGYMAPEQLHGRATPATDVYAVGATALAALTGRAPDELPHRGLRVDVRAVLTPERASESLVVTLERMLEPDPDRRASSVGHALDGAPAPEPARAWGAAPPDTAREEAFAKGMRGLLWALWGIGWLVVPMLFAGGIVARREELIPIIMFGGLAVLLTLTWHKGALLRWLYRELHARDAVARSEPRARIATPDARVRVRAESVRPDADTEISAPARRMLSPRS